MCEEYRAANQKRSDQGSARRLDMPDAVSGVHWVCTYVVKRNASLDDV